MTSKVTPIPDFVRAIATIIRENADDVTALDQAIGDGDHVTNVQRGIEVLLAQEEELSQLDWPAAFQKIGMSLMSNVGGASGSLYGTLFISLGKAAAGKGPMNLAAFADVFTQGVDAVKKRGKADLGEKTMLDVLIPVTQFLQQAAARSLPLEQVLEDVKKVAEAGVESTRDMLATKGRASFLGERARGHLDAGAKTSQLMIQAIADVLATKTPRTEASS
jgi:dihydroxyacetone kinase-like protein